MTEAEWLACTDPKPMLKALRGKTSERKLRLFGCATCRQAWHLLADGRSRNAVVVAERFADRAATSEQLGAAWSEAVAAAKDAMIATAKADWEGNPGIGLAARAAWEAAWGAKRSAGFVVKEGGEIARIKFREQATLFHDSFGNPFRRVSLDPAWITLTVTTLATAAYEERALPSGELDTTRLAVLADALEEAGCTDTDILGHLRDPGPHARGCWVLDLLLGKN